jgi:hypothetical protein
MPLIASDMGCFLTRTHSPNWHFHSALPQLQSFFLSL